MKVNFDTADYLNAKTLVWALLLIAALMIAFHAGVMHGECKARYHMKHLMHAGGQEGSFTVSSASARMMNEPMDGVTLQAMPHDVIYYRGESTMAAPAAPMAPTAGMRVIKINRGEDGIQQGFFMVSSE